MLVIGFIEDHKDTLKIGPPALQFSGINEDLAFYLLISTPFFETGFCNVAWASLKFICSPYWPQTCDPSATASPSAGL